MISVARLFTKIFKEGGIILIDSENQKYICGKPDMSKPIAIEIPAEMYQVGNVLFTPMFVKRYLEYQSLSYVFDDRYTLDIIDNEMNMLSMNSKQYAVLTEKSWTIVDISKEASDIDKDNHEEKETEEKETEEEETEEEETDEKETEEKQ